MSAKKGTVVLLHGWAQNEHVIRLRTTKLRKKLSDAGYECAYLEAPHLLPMTSTVEVNGELVEVTNGERENARAWFLYSERDGADASTALGETPVQYIGLDASIDVVKECLVQHEGGFCAILGFSQGATMCHILSMLTSAAKHDGGHVERLELRPFGAIKCAILLSGFASMHSGPVSNTAIDSTNERKLDVRSLHIFGERDTSVPKSYGEKLAGCFADPEVYDHGKGHVIPQNVALSERVIQFLDSCSLEAYDGREKLRGR